MTLTQETTSEPSVSIIDRITFKRKLFDALKVLCVTIGSIVAVVFASLVISIIQFQSRLAEARVQNSNITFESIQLIADYQSYISRLYTTMRARSEELAPLRASYLDQVNETTQQIVTLCNALNSTRANDCYMRITSLINSNNLQLDAVITEFKSDKVDPNVDSFIRVSTDGLKALVSSGQLSDLHKRYFALQKLIQSECESLSLYVSDRLANTSLLAVSPELRGTITVQCQLGGLQTVSDQSRPTAQQGPIQPSPEVQQPEQTRNETQGVNRLLLSELVFYYKFYDGMVAHFGGWVRPLILAPPEFVTIILVLSTGILGSFLFHTYAIFSRRPRDGYPTFSAIFLRATLGAMCALVLFILMRTGFVAVTEGKSGQGAAAMSPFVIAFISVAAGLLADPTMERIKKAGLSAISGRQVDGPAPQPGGRRQTTASASDAAASQSLAKDTP